MKSGLLCIGLIVITLSLIPFARSENKNSSIDETRDPGKLFVRDKFRVNTVVCPFKGEIDYEPGEIECGLLQVPENREKQDSRFIELHFVKLKSTWDKRKEPDDESGLASGKRDDPVIYLTGGPGVQVTYYIKRLKDHGIRKHRDVYILEQRGIGFSGDFCPFYATRKPKLRNAPTFEKHLDARIEARIDCAREAAAKGVDLSGYNTFENARDVKALRIALEFDRWNVWGISYGTILGQAYIKVDPEGIRAVVLDSIMPLDIRGNPWAWRSVQWYDRDLKKLDELCQSQPDCSEHYPDLGGRIREATLSVKGNPIVVDVKNTERFPTGKAYIFTDVVAFLPFAFLYEQSDYPGMPGLIYAWADAVEQRDENMFKAIAAASGYDFGQSQGMSSAILCEDADIEAQAVAGQQDIEAFPVLGTAIASVASYKRLSELCFEYNMVPRDADEYAMVKTDLPTLLIEGDMDPITPPPLAKAILPGFENGTYVEFPFAGHGPSRSVECAGNMLNAFFDHPAEKPDLNCVNEMEPPHFYVPIFKSSFGPRFIVKALEDRKSLIGHGVWAGMSILILIVSFFVLTVAPIGRRIDRRNALPVGFARLSTWLTAFFVVLSVGIIGSAIGATYNASKILLFFGLVPWARFGAISGLLAGLAGIATIAITVREHSRYKLPVGTLLGFLLTGLAAISFSVFLICWGLGPL